MAKTEDILADGLEEYKLCAENSVETENREAARDDLDFARLGNQWPEYASKSRGKDRPMLTLNKLLPFIRQVVNDARQNKPRIAVKPVDDKADPTTARIFDGLIRNIEYSSNADVAYDTGCDFAVSSGRGYWRVSVDYAHDDTFDKDIKIDRVSNPFAVYGDPNSVAADSSDWERAFIVDRYSKDVFETRWKGADTVNWNDPAGAYSQLGAPWLEDEEVQVAEWWKREEVAKTLLLLSNGEIVYEEDFAREVDGASLKDMAAAAGIQVQQSRDTRGYKITQRIMSGAEVLETNVWAGRYIPIVPVYGEEVNIDGKRYFRSLIRDAKDAQRMFNYWRTSCTELVALAPKAPWVGKLGTFDTDSAKWERANTDAIPFIEYDGNERPMREPFAGVPAGALQEALNASDDMKAILGLYDASLGARSNETSGRAIMARQQEGDVSTFHFIDNLNRAIAHTGRILIDLIPKVYNTQRIVRILGDQGEVGTVPLMQPAVPAPPGPNGMPSIGYQPAPQPQMGQNPVPGQPPMMGPSPQVAPPVDPQVFDLTVGKYDVAVEAGPSNTTQRQASVEALTQLIQSFPMAAPILGPELVKLMDFPHAQEIAQKLDAAASQAQQGGQGDNGQLVKAMGMIAQLKAQLATVKGDQTVDAMRVQIEQFEAQTDRMRAEKEILTPPPPPPQPRAVA